MTSPEKKYASKAQIAHLLDSSEAEIDRLHKKGLPRVAKDKYDPNAVVRWLISEHKKEIGQLQSMRNKRGNDELSTLFVCSPKWINRMNVEKGMPKEAHGMYDLEKVVPWMVRYLREQAEEAKKGDESMQQLEKREQAAKSILWEIKAAKMQADVINISDALPLLMDLVVSSATKMDGWKTTLAPLLIMKESPVEVQAVLDREIDRVKNELADLPNKLKGLVELRAADATSMESVPAEATPVTQRVVRSRKVDKSGSRIRKLNRKVEK